MTFIDKLERKFGRFTIKNLTLYILIAYGIGYLTSLVNPTFYSYLVMDPKLVFEGQVWRIFTWVCTKPQELDIFIIFMFMFFYWIGTNLEKVWGKFRYNLFILSGCLFMVIGALAIYGVTYFVGPLKGRGVCIPISTYYINLTSFLAFATIFGEMQVYFMMILPVKVKWLAIIDLVLIGYDMIAIGVTARGYSGTVYGSAMMEYVWCYRIYIALALLNFFLYYIGLKKGRRLSYAARQTRKEFKAKVNKIRPANNIHQCEICKRTSETDPDLTFRYCSKCNGNHEYCQEHLFTHNHIR